MRRGEDGLVWTAGGHGELDPTNADGDERADLEELAADGAAGGIGEIGRLQSQPTGTLDQDVSHRGKPQAKLVGRHSGGRGAVCKKVDLTLLDPILHLAAGAIDILVEIAAVTFGQRRDDKAGVFFAPGPLSFGNDAPLAAPALERRPGKVLEAACRLAGLLALLLGFAELGCNRVLEAGVLRQAKDVIDPIGFTPSHQGLAGEA